MEPPHYQVPTRRLFPEPGFWWCVVPTVLFFVVTGDGSMDLAPIYMLRYLLLVVVVAVGFYWVAFSEAVRRRQRFWVASFSALVCAGCGWGYLAMQLRTAVSLPWLYALANRLERGEPVTFPQQAGLFKVVSGNGARLDFATCLPNGGALDRGRELPEPDPSSYYIRLCGSWRLLFLRM